MGRTIAIGRLFGIPFRLHYSWFIVFFLLTFLLAEPEFRSVSSWLIALTTSILFFVSVLAHELAHSLVGRTNGITIFSITLFIFGGMAMMETDAKRPGAEFKMAIAGPVCSLLMGSLFAVLLLIPGIQGKIAGMLMWLAVSNGVLAVFNLIPGFPLDGGRVFRSVLWKATGSYVLASRIATLIGRGIGYLFIFSGILIIFVRPFGMSWGDGLWISAVGWFLSSAATSSYRSIVRQQEPGPAARDPAVITDADYRVMPPKKDNEA